MKSVLMGRQKAWLIPRGPAAYKDGKIVRSEAEGMAFRCLFQPLNGRELKMTPEGDQDKEQYWVFTQCMSPQMNDRIVFREKSYQIQAVEEWPEYKKLRVMKIDVGPATSQETE